MRNAFRKLSSYSVPIPISTATNDLLDSVSTVLGKSSILGNWTHLCRKVLIIFQYNVVDFKSESHTRSVGGGVRDEGRWGEG